METPTIQGQKPDRQDQQERNERAQPCDFIDQLNSPAVIANPYPVARAETRITLHVLLDRFPRLERRDLPAVRQLASPFVLGFQHLPLRLTQATH